jgi:hypothetical protein
MYANGALKNKNRKSKKGKGTLAIQSCRNYLSRLQFQNEGRREKRKENERERKKRKETQLTEKISTRHHGI